MQNIESEKRDIKPSEENEKENLIGALGENLEYIPFKRKISFALGTSSSGLLSGIVFATITFFYNTKLGLDEELLGWGWLAFGIWNTINDPIFGSIMDNTRSKLGRRIPYIRYGAFLYGLSFIICWYPIVSKNNQIFLFLNFLIVMILFDTMFSIVGTAYFCLPNEMAHSSYQRGSIAIIATLFTLISIFIQIIIPVFLLTGDDQSLNPNFKPIMIILAIITSIIMFVTSFFLKELEFAQEQDHEPFWQGIKKTLKNKPFFLFEITNFSLIFLTTIITTGAFYYIDYIIEYDIEDFSLTDPNLIPIAFMLLGVIVGAVYVLKKTKEIQPRRLVIRTLLILILGLVCFFFTGKDFITSTPFLFIAGMGAAGLFITLPGVTGDVIDYDEILTGERREGVYAGFNALLTKPAISLANWAFLSIISKFGFIKPIIEGDLIIKQTQSPIAQTGILFAITILPAAFMLLSMVGMKYYNLDGEWWLNKKNELLIIHQQKEEEFLKNNRFNIKNPNKTKKRREHS